MLSEFTFTSGNVCMRRSRWLIGEDRLWRDARCPGCRISHAFHWFCDDGEYLCMCDDDQNQKRRMAPFAFLDDIQGAVPPTEDGDAKAGDRLATRDEPRLEF